MKGINNIKIYKVYYNDGVAFYNTLTCFNTRLYHVYEAEMFFSFNLEELGYKIGIYKLIPFELDVSI